MHLEVDSLRVRRAPIRLEARNEAKPLEPEAPAYGYTYEKLFEEFIQLLPEESVRFDRYCLNEWLYFVDKTTRHAVGAELTAGFDETLTSFSNALGTKVADKTVRNIRGRIKAIQSFYLNCLEKEAIPEGFREALQFGMERMGLTPGRLIRLVGQTAYKWARGDSSPDPRHKDRCGTNMRRLEELLHFPEGTLAMRAWPAGNKVAELSDDVPHRRYLTLIQRYEYRLPIEQMPKPLQASIATYVEHKKQQTHMLPTGEVVTLPLTEIWSSEATCYNSLQLLGFYFGFLRLPKAVDPRTPWPESLQFGMGIQDEALRFTMLVNKDLLFQYMRYAEQRTFDRLHFAQYEANQAANASGASVMSHSGAGLRKTLSAAFLRFIGLCVNLVNKPTGFLRMHPEFGQELPTPVPAEAWEEWCLARSKELRSLYKAAREKVEYNKRSNKEVLNDILREDDPREYFLRVVDAMKKDVPPDTAPTWQAVHWRNLTMVALLTFACIRARNVWMLDLGRHITEQDGAYQLFIPKEEMKNFIHGYAEDIDLVFPEDLQEVLHTWITVYRPMMEGHDKTQALFVRSAVTGPKPTNGRPDYYRMDTNRVSASIAEVTKKYLGVSVRAHSFRNVGATSVVKMGGTVHQLKAILNDSEATASQVYLDITNADQTQKLTDLYNKSRARVAK